jgi:hypothetical protein
MAIQMLRIAVECVLLVPDLDWIEREYFVCIASAGEKQSSSSVHLEYHAYVDL